MRLPCSCLKNCVVELIDITETGEDERIDWSASYEVAEDRLV